MSLVMLETRLYAGTSEKTRNKIQTQESEILNRGTKLLSVRTLLVSITVLFIATFTISIIHQLNIEQLNTKIDKKYVEQSLNKSNVRNDSELVTLEDDDWKAKDELDTSEDEGWKVC